MMIVLLILILLGGPAYAQGVAVVQSAAPTSNGGTQDFTSTGFGTPVCAMFFLSYGTAAGTAVSHGMVSIGFSDFTNMRGVSVATESTGAAQDTGAIRNASNLVSQLSTDQTTDGTATAATITDGVRLTWADAPPSAYLVTAVMFNSRMFSNCSVGTITPSGVLDGTAAVSGLGWQPDLILAAYAGATTHARVSFGVAIADSGVVQYAVSTGMTDGLATSDMQSRVTNNRIAYYPPDTGTNLEVTSFDSGGFTLATRDGTASVQDMYYLTAKFASGASGKLASCSSPTSTGSHSCTGAGFAPVAAIMGHSNVTSVNSTSTSGTNSEIYGVSAFTSVASGSSMLWQDDNSATASAESMTSTSAINLRKDSAAYMVATLTGFQSDGADFNYTTTDGSAHIRFILFLKALSTRRGRPIFFQ